MEALRLFLDNFADWDSFVRIWPLLWQGLQLTVLLAVVTLQPFAIYSGSPQTVFVLVSLLVCLIPTTIGGLLSAIGIAGMMVSIAACGGKLASLAPANCTFAVAQLNVPFPSRIA